MEDDEETPEEVGPVFGLRRRKSRAVLARAELGESFDHLRQAAAYASDGVGAAVGPRVRTAQAYVTPKAAKVRHTAADGWGSTVAVLAPLATVAAQQARRASSIPDRASGMTLPKMSKKTMKKAMKSSSLMRGNSPLARGKMSAKGRRRWPLAGLLVVGAIAGTAGVVALRRRRQSEWEAYDPATDLDVVHPGGTAVVAGGQQEHGRSIGVAAGNGQVSSPTGMAGRPAGATGQTGSTAGTAGSGGTTSTGSTSGAGGGRTDGVLGSPTTGAGGPRG